MNGQQITKVFNFLRNLSKRIKVIFILIMFQLIFYLKAQFLSKIKSILSVVQASSFRIKDKKLGIYNWDKLVFIKTNRFKQNNKQISMYRDLEKSIIRSDSMNMHQTLQQMLQNFPKLPLNPRQLERLYSDYLNWNKIVDDTSKLYQMLKQANQSAVLEYFGKIVTKLLNDFDPILKSKETNLKYQEIIKILDKNQPEFMQSMKQTNQKFYQHIKELLSQYNFTTFSKKNEEIVFFQGNQQKINFVFSLLFEYMHNLILEFKNFYSLEDVSLLQATVFQCFNEYGQKSQQLFQQQKGVKQLSQKSQNKSKRSWLKSLFSGSKQTQIKQQKQFVKQQNPLSEPKIVDDLINILVQEAEDKNMIKKIQSQSKDNDNKIMKIKNYQIKPTKIIDKGSSLLPILTTKGLAKIVAKKINSSRDKSIMAYKQEISEQEQKKILSLAQTILKSHIRHNVHKQEGLSPDQFNKVQDFIKSNRGQYQIETIRSIFTQNQKQVLLQILYSATKDLKERNFALPIGNRLKQFTQYFSRLEVKQIKSPSKISIKKGISTTLSKIKSNYEILPNVFYFLVVLYEAVKEMYCPQTRRTLLKICHQIELRYNQFINQNGHNKRFCLVHALKLLQSQNINRSEVCNIITNQKPFRESQLPLVNEKQQYFQEDKKVIPCEEAQKHLQLLINKLHIFEMNKFYKQPAKMQLLKLSHSKHKKNVTILISGFLSQDTNKFQEWMGLIEPAYDSQIYALQWQSKTIQNMLEYVIETCKDLAFTGAGVGLFGGPYLKAILVLKQIITKYHSNPFVPCFDMANVTGIYFAQLIMNLFDGHFINLVGFSLGTQVIASTLERLKFKGKLHMINRVVTLGGVADKNDLVSILESTQQDIKNPISILWTNIYCQKDNILRYLLKISMPNISPIGLNEIKYPQQLQKSRKLNQKMELQNESEKMQIQQQQRKTKIYEVDNLNVTEFVDGHLSYRSNMKNIARLFGMKDE